MNVNGLVRLNTFYALLMSATAIAIFVFGLMLQRRGEYVVLRAQGLRSSELRALVLLEAAVVTVGGLAAGVLVGTLTAFLSIRILRGLFILDPRMTVPARALASLSTWWCSPRSCRGSSRPSTSVVSTRRDPARGVIVGLDWQSRPLTGGIHRAAELQLADRVRIRIGTSRSRSARAGCGSKVTIVTRYPLVLLPGGVLPAQPAHVVLLQILGERVEAVVDDLEVYTAERPPAAYGLGLEMTGICARPMTMAEDTA